MVDHEEPTERRPLWLGGAIALLLAASSVIQFWASFERWIVAWNSWDRDSAWVEDHRFDYIAPSDPWEPIGDTALLFGIGYLLMVPAILALPLAARRLRWLGIVAAIVAAAPFVYVGVHSAWSGRLGVPSPMADGDGMGFMTRLATAGLVALIVLAIVLARTSRGWMTVALLIIPTTLWGYLVGSLTIAPLFWEVSYDTTRWSETVVAAWTAAAAIVTVVATVPPQRPREPAEVSAAAAAPSA